MWRPPCYSPWRCLQFPSPFCFSSKPIPPLFHCVYCTFVTHCSALIWRCSWWGQMFPFSFRIFPSQNCLPHPKSMICSGSMWPWDTFCSSHVSGWQPWSDSSCTIPAEWNPSHYHPLPQSGNRTQNHSRSASDWQGGQEEIELTPPHACLGKAATYQFCSSYSPPSCPAGFPFSCAHDFGPPGTEFVLWKQNKAKRNPNMDQLRFMIISHFLAGTCYGSGLQITQIPRSPQLQAGAAVPHSSVLQCYSKNSLLCPFSPTISSTCTLSKLSFCSAAFLQMVSLIFQICSMLHLSLKATLLSHAITPLLFKT